MMFIRRNLWAVVKVLVFVSALLPACYLTWAALNNHLGANPIEALSRRTGDWTLRFLLITLAVTPLRRLFGWTGLLRLRRMLGLYTFFYACLHFLVYLVLDQFFDWQEILLDVAKHPYVTVGFAAFLLLIPLAATSTQAMMRRLGRRWQRLHRLVYVIAVLGVIHYWWLVKADIREPLAYGLGLALLLFVRLPRFAHLRLGAGR